MLVAMVTMPLRPAWATYFGFALVKLGVQDDVRLMPFFFSNSESRSDFSTEVVPTSTGWPVSVQLLNFIGHREIFFFLGAEDDVWILHPAQHAGWWE